MSHKIFDTKSVDQTASSLLVSKDTKLGPSYPMGTARAGDIAICEEEV